MGKIKSIIVEDEKRGMEKLVTMITDYCPNIEIIEKCYNGQSAIQAIDNLKPQLVFMDLDLGGIQGFDVLASVPHISFETIITTGDSSQGIKAVKSGALDYLVKPFGLDELQSAVKKAWKKIPTTNEITKIALPDTHGSTIIPVEEIRYVKADNNCCIVHFVSEKKPLYVVMTLGKIMDKLPMKKFCRVSRSNIVNMDEMAAYSRLDGGIITLLNDEKISLRPGKFRNEFLERLKEL